MSERKKANFYVNEMKCNKIGVSEKKSGGERKTKE